jgi:hypothetical protein
VRNPPFFVPCNRLVASPRANDEFVVLDAALWPSTIPAVKRGVVLAVVVALIALCATPLRSARWPAAATPDTLVAASKQTQQALGAGPAAHPARVVHSAAHGKLRIFTGWSRIAIERHAILTVEGFDVRPRAWLPDQRAAIRRVCPRRHRAPSADPLPS